MTVSSDAIIGALLGTAVGDALGMPIEGLSHQNVRTYYKGIKEYRDDVERGDLDAGQWTDDTQMTFAVARAMSAAPGRPEDWPEAIAKIYVDLRSDARRWGDTTTAAIQRLEEGVPSSEAGGAERPTNGAAMRAAPFGLWWARCGGDREDVFEIARSVLEVTHRHPTSLSAAWGQIVAIRTLVAWSPDDFDRSLFWQRLIEATTWVEDRLGSDDRVSSRLQRLADQIDSFPLDLRDACDGVGVHSDESWPFASAMVARRPHLLENTLLSGINVGGDADTTGAMMGAQLGALHGWAAFPDDWQDGLEDVSRLYDEAQSFATEMGRNAGG